MSQAWYKRPSELMDVHDPWTAWCLDEVTYLFGKTVENAMDEAEQNAKGKAAKLAARSRAMEMAMSARSEDSFSLDHKDQPAAPPPKPGAFKDPASLLRKQ